MNRNPARLYGLIGFPLTHSFSRQYFNQKFAAEGIDARYDNFEIPDIGDLTEVLAENINLAGLNVTIPYKQQVIPYLDEMDPDAAEIGAVNVIKIKRGVKENDITLKGYNSDVIGFVDSIRPMLTPRDTHALVLGTGGASRAVVHGLKKLGIESTLVSRTARPGVITYDDLTPEVMAANTIIVNTTPVGMYPDVDSAPAIPYDLLNSSHLCYDLLYNPDKTMFLRKAEQQGARIKNGIEMLLLQAFAAWNIWNQ